MKRILVLLALAGLTISCGDDDGDDDDKDMDAGPVDAGDGGPRTDGGGDAGVVVKVTNVGAACTASSACMGAEPTCATSSWITVGTTALPHPGGFCTATCTAAAQCGTDGICPVGELIATYGAAAAQMIGVQSGSCEKSCTPGQANACRPGYSCLTLTQLAMARAPGGDAGAAPLPLPQLSQPFCVPIPPTVPDGGVGDGGVTDAGGMDGSL